MKRTDPDCMDVQLRALADSGGLLGSLATKMLEAGADYAAISGEGDDDEPMSVVVVVVGERAAAFKKCIDKWDDDDRKPARKARRKGRAGK